MSPAEVRKEPKDRAWKRACLSNLTFAVLETSFCRSHRPLEFLGNSAQSPSPSDMKIKRQLPARHMFVNSCLRSATRHIILDRSDKVCGASRATCLGEVLLVGLA